MAKIIEATCEAGVVTADEVPVTAADILSEGVRSSEGILLLDENKAKYVTSNAEDIKDAIDKLNDILGQASDLMSSIVTDTIFIPGTGGASLIFPPGFSAGKASLDAAIEELNAMKDNLK